MWFEWKGFKNDPNRICGALVSQGDTVIRGGPAAGNHRMFTISCMFLDSSTQPIENFPLIIRVVPGLVLLHRTSSILRLKRGYKRLSWYDDNSDFNKTCEFELSPNTSLIRGEFDSFLKGRRFLEELLNAHVIREVAQDAYALAKFLTSILYGIENNILEREIIPKSDTELDRNDSYKGDAERIIKLSVKPQNITSTKPSEDHAAGWHNRLHDVGGHWVTRGRCKEGNPDRLNLCQPEPTIHPRKFYCKKCFKKKTFKVDFKRGDATLGKIKATYEAVSD